MTPKTQSVCKHCPGCGSISRDVRGVVEPPIDSVLTGKVLSCDNSWHEPVAEPASTGEPPPKECPSCNSTERGFCTLAFTGVEHLHNGPDSACCKDLWHIWPAARPSEPSAPQQTEAQHRTGIAAYGTTLKVLAEIDKQSAAPQTSAEPCPICESTKLPHAVGLSCHIPTPIREINEFPAAPQPVSGDAPTCALCVDAEEIAVSSEAVMACPKCCPCKYGCTREQYCVSCTVHRPKKLAGDAPKVEEIARQIAEKLVAHHLSVWQGLEKAVELYIELIIPFLRPYLPPECFYCKFYGQEHCKRHFPPASQTPINTHELAHEILRHRIIILECENGVKPCGEYNGEPIYNMGEMIGAETIAINQLQDVIDAWLKRQPASTARTDGLKQLRDDGWMVAVHNDYRVNGKFHTFWLLTRVGREGQFVKGEGETDEDALAQIVRQLASHAAPGSVPQAEPPKEEKP